jgi:hypothetical protein
VIVAIQDATLLSDPIEHDKWRVGTTNRPGAVAGPIGRLTRKEVGYTRFTSNFLKMTPIANSKGRVLLAYSGGLGEFPQAYSLSRCLIKVPIQIPRVSYFGSSSRAMRFWLSWPMSAKKRYTTRKELEEAN